jgi:hypothetical protein
MELLLVRQKGTAAKTAANQEKIKAGQEEIKTHQDKKDAEAKICQDIKDHTRPFSKD